MPCYKPLKGYRARTTNQSGKRSIVFNVKDGFIDLPVEVPCGQCIGCRLERSRQWAIRCVHEASLYEQNCFLTLTYNDENLPYGGTLVKKHFQDFMKRLRKSVYPKKIRFFHCGEYGEELKRPHYHAIIFNYDPEDKILWAKSKGQPLFISETLNKLWKKGFVTIGNVTFESAAYVARYIMKKVNGELAEEHYQSLETETGEIQSIQPEYVTMSRRPGIAKEWYENYKNDVYPDDFIVCNGTKMRPPKYYDKNLEATDPEYYKRLKLERIGEALQHKEDNTPQRLKVRESVKKAQINLLKRNVE